MINKLNSNNLFKGPIGGSGPVVSKLALGTMTFGSETSKAEAIHQLDLFKDSGGTLIDTADVYSDGRSEEILGLWGKQRSGFQDMILSTKGRFAPPIGSYGASRRSLSTSIEKSLKRLQVDAIDIYYVHGWDKYTDINETLSTLNDLVSAGKVHYIGWSNLTGWQLQKILTTAKHEHFPSPIVLQSQYNLLDRGIELEVLPCCLESKVGLVPWSPLGGGWLTGKYTQNTRPSGATRLGENPSRGVEAYDLRNTSNTHAVIEALTNIANKHNCSCAQVALAWLQSRPAVSSILVGARTVEQLKQNLGSNSIELEETDIKFLTALSSPGLPAYPYGFEEDWSEMEVWKKLGT